MEENDNIKSKTINYVEFNFDSSYFSVGTDIGFLIYQTSPLELIFERNLNGGIGLVKILEQTNIFCLAGGGSHPRFSPNKLIIWDDKKNEISEEFRCNSFVINCYIKQYCIIIICSDNITFINSKTMKIIKCINTINNPRGISSISNDPKKYIFAYPDINKGNILFIKLKEFEEGNDEQINKIKKLEVKEDIIKNAHKGNINVISLNFNGSKLASASDRGTLVRVFDLETKMQIKEFRRGNSEANIYSLSFSFDDSLLGLTSNHGSCHIFNLNNSIIEKKNNSGMMGYITNNFSLGGVGKKLSSVLGQEYSWKKIVIPHKVRSFISFIVKDNSNVFIIDKSGNYLSINLTIEQEPKITQQTKILLN